MDSKCLWVYNIRCLKVDLRFYFDFRTKSKQIMLPNPSIGIRISKESVKSKKPLVGFFANLGD